MLKRAIPPLLALVGIAVCSFVAGKLSASDAPGGDPYTPTKLEWAALNLTASVGSAYGAYVLQFVPLGDSATVEARVTWGRSKDALSRNAVRGFIKARFEDFRSASGWTWLKLRISESDRSGPALEADTPPPKRAPDGK